MSGWRASPPAFSRPLARYSLHVGFSLLFLLFFCLFRGLGSNELEHLRSAHFTALRVQFLREIFSGSVAVGKSRHNINIIELTTATISNDFIDPFNEIVYGSNVHKRLFTIFDITDFRFVNNIASNKLCKNSLFTYA